jgi:hypothetical protein
LDAPIGKYGPIFADKATTILTAPTETDGTLHIPFHGEKDVLGSNIPLLKLKGGKTHHDLWSTDQSHGIERIK